MSQRKPNPGGKPAPFNEKQVERIKYLKFEEEMPLQDIARIMGTSKNTVSLLIRGIRAASAAGTTRPVRVEGRKR